MRNWLLSILLGVALSAGACGDDSGGDAEGGGSSGDGDGPGNVESGVDGSMAATEVSEDDASTLCMAFESAVEQAEEIEIDCTASAVMDTQDEQACIERRDGCIEVESRNAADDNCEGEEIVRGLATCAEGVTVGDIEDCLNELIAWEASLTCADAGDATPPSCFGQLLDDCPDLFDGEDTEDGDGAGGEEVLDCIEDDSSTAGVDCESWCQPLANAGCEHGPNMQECVFICGEAKTTCPGLVGALYDCQQAEEPTWECDADGDPDLTSCGLELSCFGGCVDAITN